MGGRNHFPERESGRRMSNSLSDTISTLNTLIETCKEGQEGFRLAAEAITDDEDLKGFLFSCSLQRSKFAGELQNEAIALGEADPEQHSTAISALHRGWIQLKTVLTGNENHAILAECERGEDSAVAEYRKAVNTSHLSATLMEIVKTQFQEVLATHNSVRGSPRSTRGPEAADAFHWPGGQRLPIFSAWQDASFRRLRREHLVGHEAEVG